MFRVQDLSVAFAIVVVAIFVGIGTGYFNRGPKPIAPVPAPSASPVTPAAPAPPVPAPAPAPFPSPSPGSGPPTVASPAGGVAVNPGEYVDGSLKTWCIDEQGRRTENPASAFRLTILGSGQAQFRPGSPTGGGAVMPGTFDAATGKAVGRYEWPDGAAYTRWSATLARSNGVLTVAGLACSAPKSLGGARCGGWFWGPPGSPEIKTGDSDPGCG
jgi:hypothetical protein